MFSNSVTFVNNIAVACNVSRHANAGEESPRRGRNAYVLSKLLTEHIAEEFVRNDPTPRVTSLRFSYV